MKTLTTKLQEQIKNTVAQLAVVNVHYIDDLCTAPTFLWIRAGQFYHALKHDRVIPDHVRDFPTVVRYFDGKIVPSTDFEQVFDFVHDFLKRHADIQSCSNMLKWMREDVWLSPRETTSCNLLVALVIVLVQHDYHPEVGISWDLSAYLSHFFSDLAEVAI